MNFSDDFNRADSTNLGANWTEVTNDFQIKDGRLCNLTASSDTTLLAVVGVHSPNSPDYSIQGDVSIVSGGNEASVGLVGRYADTTHFYMARVNVQSTNLELYLFNGSATLLGSYAMSAVKDTVYTLKLELIGSAIKAYLNGVERISVTNAVLTAAGKAATRCFINNAGANFPDLLRLDNFVVTDIPDTSTIKSSNGLLLGI